MLSGIPARVARAMRLSERAAEKLAPLIADYIGEGENELVRLGIPLPTFDAAPSADAVVSYALYRLSSGKDADRMYQQFEVQADNLRKHKGDSDG